MTQDHVQMSVVGFRRAAEGDEGGGAFWDNETKLELLDDQVRIVETDDVHHRVRTEKFPIDDIAGVVLSTSHVAGKHGCLKIKHKKKSFLDYLLKTPDRIDFTDSQQGEFVAFADRLEQELQRRAEQRPAGQ
ncbi:MAG: hypothetical protein ACLFVU_07865 [Phycisphaerae bacterium]